MICACGKEFANKSNFNRHMKKCQSLQPVQPVAFDTGSETTVYEKESPEPEPNTGMTEVFEEPTIDITKIPKNTELLVNFSLPENTRVFLDRLDGENPDAAHPRMGISTVEHVWVKIDSLSQGRRMQKIHVSDIRMVMMEEPK